MSLFFICNSLKLTRKQKNGGREREREKDLQKPHIKEGKREITCFLLKPLLYHFHLLLIQRSKNIKT